ncbi:MAG TPA: NRDE family protein [Methylomirabilota bacterium]|nr:NRDE family protein [Methylomirabilota bacterium]
MCLLVVAWQADPELPLVLAGNRDEFHHRPAAPAGWWEAPGGVVGGRDLEAGGSWLALHRSGRIAVVTNFREPLADSPGRRSRGELVVGAVTSEGPLEAWLNRLAGRGDDYGGFNLVVGDGRELHVVSNRGGDRRCLPPGVYGLSNHLLDTPWPKVAAAKARLRRWLADPRRDREGLFGILADRQPAPDDELPDTGVPEAWERLLSSAFIVSPRYGTRASTVVLVRADGGTELVERRFAPDGSCTGESAFEVPGPS